MVVEPPGGWPKVDHEFYVVQGDIYLKGDPAESGVHEAAVDKMKMERPDYVIFNGSSGSLAKERARSKTRLTKPCGFFRQRRTKQRLKLPRYWRDF
ncbi:MAG: hypothetical protein J2P49_03090 [Methylocapsa sp.]|nr:hypothetical protein [Methylocapsa sp.]